MNITKLSVIGYDLGLVAKYNIDFVQGKIMVLFRRDTQIRYKIVKERQNLAFLFVDVKEKTKCQGKTCWNVEMHFWE